MYGMIGDIIAFAGAFTPQGWEVCAGQLLPITSGNVGYQVDSLGDVLSDRYGEENGEVNVPDIAPLISSDGQSVDYLICSNGLPNRPIRISRLGDIRYQAVPVDYFNWLKCDGGFFPNSGFENLTRLLRRLFNTEGDSSPLTQLPNVPQLSPRNGPSIDAMVYGVGRYEPFPTGRLSTANNPYAGQVALFVPDYVPSGWLPCDGRSVRAQDFPRLFKVLRGRFSDDTRTRETTKRAQQNNEFDPGKGPVVNTASFQLPNLPTVPIGNGISLPYIICADGLLPSP